MKLRPTRRHLLGCLAAAPAALRAYSPLVVGFVYNGPKNDLGYNQSHAEGKLSLQRKLPWVKALDEANVAETVAVEESMRDMIVQEGASAIFATSYGYFDPFTIDIAREYPSVQFFHCGGLYKDGNPKNIGIYFGFIDEVEYLSGMLAGLATKSGRIGFIAAMPIPQVLRNINSFTLGARSVNPKVTTQVIFTGDWVLPVREAEAASSLVDQGIDVLTGHTGSPRVIVQIAEQRGVFACGYQFNQSSMAPKGFLTGAEWSWGTVYVRYAEMMHEGKCVMNGTIPRRLSGTLKDQFCRLSPFGPSVTESMRKRLADTKAAILNGSLQIYSGPLRDNRGRIVIPAGKILKIHDPALDQMYWLLEGVNGSIQG